MGLYCLYKEGNMAKLYAQRIHAGKMAIEDVPERWREETRAKYLEIYGEELA